MKKVLVSLFIFGVGVLGFAQNAKVLEGINYHNSAVSESDGFAQKAIDTLKPFIDSDANARAYFGSAITITAGYVSESNPFRALDLLEEGSRYIDEAVEMDKNNIDVRLVRLVNGMSVSKQSPYKRYAVIKADVDFFLEENRLENMSDEDKAYVYYNCALYRLEEGDIDAGLDLLDLVVASGKKSDIAKEAKKLISRYEE